MESLEVVPFGGIYKGLRVLVTGHTGFKGSWLALWLARLGANVTGISLDPATTPNHWNAITQCATDIRVDIRDLDATIRGIQSCEPDIVFHLAAQTLVRESYEQPLTSWSTNVMGTANVLEACRRTPSVRAIVAATTDKVYANQEWDWGYRENDRLGGHDPYSASKAAVELVADSYQKSYFHLDGSPLLATVRAGNVFGGGDWALGRLIPDVVRACLTNGSLEIRSPMSVRPWQHVLECLSGYLMLGRRLLNGDVSCASAWNFGPPATDCRTVLGLLELMKSYWPELSWTASTTPGPHEAAMLSLDCSKAHRQLGWAPTLRLHEALALTTQWYRHFYEAGATVSEAQLDYYVNAAQQRNCAWNV
ncbi:MULTISPECIES: CDP-glucose 4,6-dehydratase [Achromobacter]|uniref:CDP-glucose 4,6-dehydratase n=1 Tax=Achromobacter piechaudii TaxID=72556 RepID=A0A6S7ESK8_9BURK|nr:MULTISPECIES: CDP-glucose 4,6-dehydratase [Achromobacter]MPS79496.1 CDP-glucose 4,6-dehydratase [Achromobacter sp.]CAB3920935.1 CDP-glucose 4,6-dehydratase [Achromobacter piechaudii]